MKEKWVSEIESISIEIVHSEEERKKKIFLMKNTSETCRKTKMYNIHVTGIPERGETGNVAE